MAWKRTLRNANGLAALREGYLVHVASDAVSSRAEWNWKIGLDRMRDAGAALVHRDDDVRTLALVVRSRI